MLLQTAAAASLYSFAIILKAPPRPPAEEAFDAAPAGAGAPSCQFGRKTRSVCQEVRRKPPPPNPSVRQLPPLKSGASHHFTQLRSSCGSRAPKKDAFGCGGKKRLLETSAESPAPEVGHWNEGKRDLRLLLIGCWELETFRRPERPLLASLHSLDTASPASALLSG